MDEQMRKDFEAWHTMRYGSDPLSEDRRQVWEAAAALSQPAAADVVATFKCWEEPRYEQKPRQVYELQLTQYGNALPSGEYSLIVAPKATP